MAIENVQQLLTEQLGKNRCDVITTTAMTGKDYYAVHFVTESVIASIAASNIQTGTSNIMKILKLGQSLGGSNAPSGAAAFENLYSLDFDGVDDYLTCGDSDVLTPNSSGANRGFSISFWVLPSVTGGEMIISKSGFWNAGARRYEYAVLTQFATKPR